MLIKCDLDFIKIIAQDPIRPVELLGDPKRRFEHPLEVYALVEKQGFGVATNAVACIAHSWFVPETEADIYEISQDPEGGEIVVPYSLWSNQKGSGRLLINALRHYFKDYAAQLITMSPKPEMAQRFHESNGAVLIQSNKESNNFEYPCGDAGDYKGED